MELEAHLDYRPLTRCVCCGSTVLISALDLLAQPPANNYARTPEEEQPVYPLGLNYCPICTHLQLTHAVNPDILFKNYLYVSGTTDTMPVRIADM